MAETSQPIRLLDLPGAEDPGRTSLAIQPDEVGFPDQERSNLSMMKEANTNRLLSEAFTASRNVVASWNLTELMLRAYVEPRKWRGSDQFRSHLGIPLLAENFYSMLSVIQQTLFAGYRPFMIDPTASTSIEAAQAQEALLMAELKTGGFKGVTIKQEMRAICYDGLLYGTGVGFIGWETKKIQRKQKRTKQQTQTIPSPQGGIDITTGNEDEIEEYVAAEYEVNRPVLEHVPIRRFRVAPDCRRGDVRTASWAGRIIYLDSYQLDQLRDVEGFNIPTREQLISLTTPQKVQGTQTNVFDTQGANTLNPVFQQTVTPTKAYPESYDAATVDPLAKKWEIFEYCTADRVVWVLEGEYCLRNETHNLGRIPFLSFCFREAPESFFGYGMGFWLTDFQRIAQGISNAFFDDLNLNLMGVYQRQKGLNTIGQAEWVFPGKVFASDTAEGFKPLARNAIMNDPLQIVEVVKGWASGISGAGIGIQGSNPGKAGDMRTGAGVNALQSGEATKTQDLIDQICELVFIPFLEFCVEQNGKLKPSQVREMLSQHLGAAFKSTPMDVLNGTYKITIAAGPRLAARQALNQSLGFIQSILQSPGVTEQLATQAMKMDFGAMLNAFLESVGYPYIPQVFVPMSEDDKKRLAAQQQTPPPKAQEIQMQTEAKKAIDDNQSENRLILKQHEAGVTADQTAMDQAFERAHVAGLKKEEQGYFGGK